MMKWLQSKKNLEKLIKLCNYYFDYYYSRETFKYLSAIGFGGNVWSIPLNCYTDFVKQVNLVDGNIIKFA